MYHPCHQPSFSHKNFKWEVQRVTLQFSKNYIHLPHYLLSFFLFFFAYGKLTQYSDFIYPHVFINQLHTEATLQFLPMLFATYRCTLLSGPADSTLTSYTVDNQGLIPDSINDLSSAVTSRPTNQNFQSPGNGLAIHLTVWWLKLDAQYHWHQNAPLDVTLSNMNSSLILTNYFLKMHLNVILPPPRLIVWYMQIQCNKRFTQEAHCAKFVSHLLNKNEKQNQLSVWKDQQHWNQKQWRCLFFLLCERDEDMRVLGRFKLNHRQCWTALQNEVSEMFPALGQVLVPMIEP